MTNIIALDDLDLDTEMAALREAFADVSLGPPAGWYGVHLFETEHGIVLPEPYRTFLATIGDSCPDGPPGHGLVRPGARSIGMCPQTPFLLAREFPLIEEWRWEHDERPEEVVAPIKQRVLFDGTLHLGTDGSGENWQLVITGEHRGQIWYVTDDGAEPFGDTFGNTTAAPGFGGWIRHWAAGRDWFDATE